MADGYDALYEIYLGGIPVKPLRIIYVCTKNRARFIPTISRANGGVDHFCRECARGIHTSWAEYDRYASRDLLLEITCPDG